MSGIFCELYRKLGFSSLSLRRLEADIDDFEIAFHRYKLITEQEGKDCSWIDSCNAHLKNAKKACENCEVDTGYQSLLNAERDAISGMPAAERQARVISLKSEIKKKLDGSWRCEAALALLNEQPETVNAVSIKSLLNAERDAISGMPAAEKQARVISLKSEIKKKLDGSWRCEAALTLLHEQLETVNAESIKEALFHRNTYSQNIYRKIELLRNQLLFIGFLLIVLLTTAIISALREGLGVLAQPLSGQLLPYALYMGILGGTLSAAFSVTKTESNAKIPDAQRTRMITLARSAIGGAAAIPVFILIQGNLIKLMDTPFTPWAALFFCFLAGFSERWFLGTLETFTKAKSADEKVK